MIEDRRSKGGRRIALFLATLPALTILVVSLGDAIYRLFVAWKVWGDGPELPFAFELGNLSLRFAGVRALSRMIAILLLGIALLELLDSILVDGVGHEESMVGDLRNKRNVRKCLSTTGR